MEDIVEQWRPVVGYEGLYEVSDCGRVKSLRTGKLMSDKPSKSLGYVLYKLSAHGHKKDWYGHTLVLTAFIGPRPAKHECRHLNGKRNDNRLCNLAWGTPRDNDNDRRRHGTFVQGESHGAAKLTDEKVLLIRNSTGTQASISATFGISRSLVSMIKSRKRWTHIQ